MPRTDNEIRIVPSVLDRLLDYEPERSRESMVSRSRNLRHLKQSVRRDIEWLLNTRQANLYLPADLRELNRSVGAYGLPDFSHLSVKSPVDMNYVLRAIEAAIGVFEPRLQDVRVTLDSIQSGEPVLYFRIDARLRVKPAPEPIAFDSVMRLGTGECLVKES